jgi:hypothetical protein
MVNSKQPVFRPVWILPQIILRTWASENIVNLDFYLAYNCKWIINSRNFNQYGENFRMTYSLEDIFELLGESSGSQNILKELMVLQMYLELWWQIRSPSHFHMLVSFSVSGKQW